LDGDVIEQIELAAKYGGYFKRQQIEVEKLRRTEGVDIPASFDYGSVTGLRNEAREKLVKFRPSTLGQASRISGVSPADLGILMVHLKRYSG